MPRDIPSVVRPSCLSHDTVTRRHRRGDDACGGQPDRHAHRAKPIDDRTGKSLRAPRKDIGHDKDADGEEDLESTASIAVVTSIDVRFPTCAGNALYQYGHAGSSLAIRSGTIFHNADMIKTSHMPGMRSIKLLTAPTSRLGKIEKDLCGEESRWTSLKLTIRVSVRYRRTRRHTKE